MTKTVDELSDLSPPSDTNPNYCHRKVDKTDSYNRKVNIECGGKIVIDDWKFDGTKATVNSHCGGCNAKEMDEFKAPSIKHHERCSQAQTRLSAKPTIYLQTIIPVVVWKCGGVYDSDRKEYVYCDGMIIQDDGGFPF